MTQPHNEGSKVAQLVGGVVPQQNGPMHGPVHGEIVVLPPHEPAPSFDLEALECALAHAVATSQVGQDRAAEFVPAWLNALGN